MAIHVLSVVRHNRTIIYYFTTM